MSTRSENPARSPEKVVWEKVNKRLFWASNPPTLGQPSFCRVLQATTIRYSKHDALWNLLTRLGQRLGTWVQLEVNTVVPTYSHCSRVQTSSHLHLCSHCACHHIKLHLDGPTKWATHQQAPVTHPQQLACRCPEWSPWGFVLTSFTGWHSNASSQVCTRYYVCLTIASYFFSPLQGTQQQLF